VSTCISGFRHLGAPDEAASRIVRAFANLLRGLAPVREGAGEHPHRSALPAAAAVTGGLVALVLGPIGFFGIAGSHDCTEATADGDGVPLKSECGGTAAIGLVVALGVGAIASAVARAVARPRMSGHSDSHRRLFYVSAAAFAWVAFATFLASAAIGYRGR
jgi:hypothetical protein